LVTSKWVSIKGLKLQTEVFTNTVFNSQIPAKTGHSLHTWPAGKNVIKFHHSVTHVLYLLLCDGYKHRSSPCCKKCPLSKTSASETKWVNGKTMYWVKIATVQMFIWMCQRCYNTCNVFTKPFPSDSGTVFLRKWIYLVATVFPVFSICPTTG